MCPCFAPFDRLDDTVLDKRYVYALSRLHSHDQAGIPHCGVPYAIMLAPDGLLRLKARRKPDVRNSFDTNTDSCYTHIHPNLMLTTVNGKSTHQGAAQRTGGW